MIRSESVRWRKSSRSGSQSDCVEVAHTRAAMRDSKNPAAVLLFDRVLVGQFMAAVKSGRFG